ncbi:hypothetical protein G210_1216, partial [Candida maltosa Xu316]
PTEEPVPTEGEEPVPTEGEEPVPTEGEEPSEGPEPAVPTTEPSSPVQENEPFTINALLNDERIWFYILGNNIGVTTDKDSVTPFTVVEGFIFAGESQLLFVEEDGLLTVVDNVADATPGWQIIDGVLSFDYPEGINARDVAAAVFSACEGEDGELVVYIGEASGCQLMSDVEIEAADEEEPADEQTDEPTGEEPTGEEPTGEEPTGEEPTGEEPTEVPTGEEPTEEATEGPEPTGEEPSESEGGVLTETVTHEVVITETHCDENSSCTQVVKTVDGFITTVTDEVIVTITSCEEETICQTTEETQKTVYTTFCPLETKGDQVTVTITSCSGDNACTEIPTVIDNTEGNTLTTDYIVSESEYYETEEDTTITVTQILYVTVGLETTTPVPTELVNAGNVIGSSSGFIAGAIAVLLPLFM